MASKLDRARHKYNTIPGLKELSQTWLPRCTMGHPANAQAGVALFAAERPDFASACRKGCNVSLMFKIVQEPTVPNSQ